MREQALRIDGTSDARYTLVLAHGAGAGMDSPFLADFASELRRFAARTLAGYASCVSSSTTCGGHANAGGAACPMRWRCSCAAIESARAARGAAAAAGGRRQVTGRARGEPSRGRDSDGWARVPRLSISPATRRSAFARRDARQARFAYADLPRNARSFRHGRRGARLRPAVLRAARLDARRRSRFQAAQALGVHDRRE